MRIGNNHIKNLVIGASVLSAVGHVNAQEKQPNIVLIITDQQTAEAMSNRGNPHLNTPAMDQLANDGVTFPRAYCSYPLSGPSRASIFTGKMPNEVSIRDNEQSLPDEARLNSLGFKISDVGYDCLYAGKWHVPTIHMPKDESFGFKNVCDMNDPEMAFHIEKELSKKRDNPFFLVASYLNPHEACEYARFQTLHYGEINIPQSDSLPPLPENFLVPDDLPEVVSIHKGVSPKLYPTQNYTLEDWRRYLYAYNRLVERVDNEIGKLLDILKEKGLYDNSVIIFTSDHGDGVGAHEWNQKRVLFEENINIPLIIKPENKSKIAKASINQSLINIGTDIFPTVCEYANAETPKDLNGISIKRIIEDKSQPSHESILIETNLDGLQGARGWSVIKGDYKYVFYRFFKNKEQLFNLKKDKGEMNNLMSDPAYNETYQMMKSEMMLHAKKTNDKMLIKDLNF